MKARRDGLAARSLDETHGPIPGPPPRNEHDEDVQVMLVREEAPSPPPRPDLIAPPEDDTHSYLLMDNMHAPVVVPPVVAPPPNSLSSSGSFRCFVCRRTWKYCCTPAVGNRCVDCAPGPDHRYGRKNITSESTLRQVYNPGHFQSWREVMEFLEREEYSSGFELHLSKTVTLYSHDFESKKIFACYCSNKPADSLSEWDSFVQFVGSNNDEAPSKKTVGRKKAPSLSCAKHYVVYKKRGQHEYFVYRDGHHVELCRRLAARGMIPQKPSPEIQEWMQLCLARGVPKRDVVAVLDDLCVEASSSGSSRFLTSHLMPSEKSSDIDVPDPPIPLFVLRQRAVHHLHRWFPCATTIDQYYDKRSKKKKYLSDLAELRTGVSNQDGADLRVAAEGALTALEAALCHPPSTFTDPTFVNHLRVRFERIIDKFTSRRLERVHPNPHDAHTQSQQQPPQSEQQQEQEQEQSHHQQHQEQQQQQQQPTKRTLEQVSPPASAVSEDPTTVLKKTKVYPPESNESFIPFDS